MPPLQILRSTSSRRPNTTSTRSGCLPIRFYNRGSATCSSARSVALPSVLRQLQLSVAKLEDTRRVVAKVEWHPGELYPRVGFIVTNLSRPAERVVAFYNKRG